MIIAIVSILIVINVVGLLNRNKIWSKVFLVSQVFFIGGMLVIFTLFNNDRGIEANKKQQQNSEQIDDAAEKLVKSAKEKADSADQEQETQSGNKVKGF